MSAFPYYRQLETMDCGPTCLRMIARFYGKNFSLETLRHKTRRSRSGVSLLGISKAAEQIGFRTVGAKVSYEALQSTTNLPCIAHWNQDHFVVIYKIKRGRVYVADPGRSLLSYQKKEFLEKWRIGQNTTADEGIVLFIEPTPSFYTAEEEINSSIGITKIVDYLRSHRRLFAQLVLGLLVGALIQGLMPFFTRAIVDIGISTHDVKFIYTVLAGQLLLSVGQTAVEFIRGWILLHISTRISIAILSDFLMKLLRLPLSFFDASITGDIIQRINDQRRIELFLTSTLLNTLFSLVSLVVFGSVLFNFSRPIFSIFLVGSLLYMGWVMFFLRFRKQLDYKRFDVASSSYNNITQLIGGIHEIKLNDCGSNKLWEWERIQAKLFNYNTQSLSLSQYQQVGAFFINHTKNILIIFYAAQAVLQGTLSLGEMLAIQFIVGQLNLPVEQLIQFTQSAQDAKISVDRLNDVHRVTDEEPDDKLLISSLPDDKSISLRDVSFTYPGAGNKAVLSGLDIDIPQGKITAIVGDSGSGKTTILKLLLKIQQPESGRIAIEDTDYNTLSHAALRRDCGVVMQDGYIFSDTIANNIMVSSEEKSPQRLLHALRMANIEQFVKDSALGLNTKIGVDGNGLSQGQKQRILIARAIYKNPSYLFLDEATNALDANNEKAIMENLNLFFKGRTVVVVAHRLSTVKNADQIIVLQRGRVTERGTHDELVRQEGPYYQLVRNQLNLGN
ncbi:ABC transporter ATP-binding protein [Hymenobacter frigidus]|uniref:ABC transporter ATP-binding protein n=1 Tax=Hymenobacter frigidus TaxID=1524095 RepID=A0ABQ2ACW2_9BACT|nr:peptidase domain-containing ABC transporter [Hymenobacter frigidus]GGH88506.1 ABC transporter ATP-binding protein [Hymenobacter frigidus]